jgi:uncharacterized protein (TIGR02145 family)
MATYYVAPAASGGSDSNAGTIGSPWLTITEACLHVAPGDIVYVRGGTYLYGQVGNEIHNISGVAGNLITIMAYPGEHPVFDYSAETFTTAVIGIHFYNVAYTLLKGIRIIGITQPIENDISQYGIWLSQVTNTTIEFCECDHIGGWGFRTYNNCNNILYLNCDSHHNEDPYSPTPYGGADGFQSDSSSSTNITYRYCRAWANSDDGWDTRLSRGNITIDGCWSFWNGYIPSTVGSTWESAGDGDGIKMSSDGDDGVSTTMRWIQNCLCFENKLVGIESGVNEAPYIRTEIYNNISYSNGTGGISAGDVNYSIIRNNISYSNSGSNFSEGANVTHDHNNSLIDGSGPVVSDADFISINSVGMDGARQADGSLPVRNFLKLMATSALRGAGLAISGLTTDCAGNAWGTPPSLGAYEYGSTPPDIPVTSITVTGEGSATTITTPGGTLQMVTDILPVNATIQTVTWGTHNYTGSGYCDQDGLFHAVSNGTVLVQAFANDGTFVHGDLVITISNQTIDPLIAIIKSLWKFNEPSGVAIDAMGFMNLTVYGATQNIVGKLNKCYSFDGINDYVGGVNEYKFQSISLVRWFKTGVTGTWQNLMSNYYYDAVAGTEQGYDFVINNQNKIEWAVRNSIAEYSIINSTSEVTDDNWHMAVVTFGATYQKVYVDAVLEDTSAAWAHAITYHANSRFLIAKRQDDLFFGGLGDLSFVCEGVLTQEQINTIWNGGNGLDYPFTPIVSPPIETPVTGITISSEGDATTIETPGGSLQMYAAVLPIDADDTSVTWSIVSGLADIGMVNGLLTAVGNGVVVVRATANDLSGVYDDFVVTVSNQLETNPAIAPDREVIGTLNGVAQRILIVKPCKGYYMRWYFCGWHYWFFIDGDVNTLTEGEKYRTLGTRKLAMSSGQVTSEQVIAIRTIMHTREVQLLNADGWANMRIEPGTVNIFDNGINGGEIELVAIVGSKTTYTPVPVVPDVVPIDFVPDCPDVIIGTQVWMCRNYNSKYPGSKVYNNDEDNRLIYGGLYSFAQVKTEGFCPTGWKVPSLTEWQTLITYLGSDPGGKLKEIGTTLWNAPNTGAVDTYNFAAKPTGYFISVFAELGNLGLMWTSDEHDANYARSIALINTDSNIVQGTSLKTAFFGVRLLRIAPATNKDIYGGLYNWAAVKSGLLAPTGFHIPTEAEYEAIILTLDANYIYPSSAIAGSKLKEVGTNHWAGNSDATNISGFTALGAGGRGGGDGGFYTLQDVASFHTSTFDINTPLHHQILELSGNDGSALLTISYFGDAGLSVRCIKDYTILTEGQTGTTIDIDGNIYPTKVIGGYEIMTLNLKTEHYNNGDSIPLVTDNAPWAAGANTGIGAVCYYNNG